MIKNILALALLILISYAELLAQPKIQVLPSATLDLGDLYKGQKGEAIVTIKNAGTEMLRISQVKASCGCTAALLRDKKENLEPSDTVQLSITFDSQGMVGKITKQVTITSNDTSNSKLVIQFTANVIEVLKLSPPYFSFHHTVMDSTYTQTMTLTNPSKVQGINILSVETKFDNLKVTLMKNSLMPGEETQLQAVFRPTKSGVPEPGSIILTTDHKHEKVLQIKVYAWVNRK